MANSITLTSGMTSVVDNIRVSGQTNLTANTTSSNAIAASTTVNNSTWTALSLDGLTDVAALWVQNDNTQYSSSVVTVATGSAGQNVLTILPSGYASLIAWSGPLSSLYGKITGGSDTSGVVQMIAQQS